MRLLYFIAMYGTEFLGQELHRELIHEFQARGHEVRVFALAGREQNLSPSQPTWEEDIPVFRASVDRALSDRALNRLGKPVFIYNRFLSGLRHYIRHVMQDSEFDLAHVELAYPMGAIAALAQPLVRRPFVVHIGGGDLLASTQARYGYARYPTARALLRFTFARACLVRAVSPHAAEMAEQLGCPREKIMVIPRNISRDSFSPADVPGSEFHVQARARVGARWGLADAPLIVTTGRLLPIKGFEYLIRALPQINRAAKPARLLIIGPDRGDYGRELRQLAEACQVRDQVTFAGALPKREMRDHLAAADMVVVPSIEEGGNKMVLEAAAAGTPFVATAQAGTPDYAQAWNCGLVVPPRDSEALARACVQLLQTPAQRMEMGKNGREFANNFTAELIAERLLSAYRLAMDGQALPDEFHYIPAPLRKAAVSK